nr:transposase, MuDR, MULE transposase domain protein [Tanacetum cinerariifolium]
MTSNSVESVNACSVIYRKEPVLKLAETYCAMVQEWYYKRRQLAANMTYEITDWAASKVAKKRMKNATWVVNGVNAYQYEVSDENIQKAIPPRMDNPQPGRPKNTNRIKSQGEEPRIIRCTR